MKIFLRFVILKLVSLMLVGTAGASPVHDFAKAIARTEGFYVRGTVPNRFHNPGDIRSFAKGVRYPGQIGTSPHGYVIFKSDHWGWMALENQIQKVIDGTSTKYTQEMSFAQIAKVYAQDKRWGVTVCKILRITPTMTFEEYFSLPPRMRFVEVTWPNALVKTLTASTSDVVYVGSATDANMFTWSVPTDGGSDALIFDGGRLSTPEPTAERRRMETKLNSNSLLLIKRGRLFGAKFSMPCDWSASTTRK
jgi:hypothetical protein